MNTFYEAVFTFQKLGYSFEEATKKAADLIEEYLKQAKEKREQEEQEHSELDETTMSEQEDNS